MKNLGNHTIKIQVVLNESGVTEFGSKPLPSHKIKFSITGKREHASPVWGQFHRAAKQRKLLTRNICLADFLGYQPNLHVKLMYFGW